MITSKVGGALRSRTLFWVRRRRASSSPRVTLWIPPMRSDRVGLSIRLSRLLPCAVPISWTPRSAIVRAACASSSVPISSMTMTWGMWFSTASIITSCCSDGRADLHPAGLADRRVRDVAVAGDLVGRVDDDDPLAEVVGEDAGRLAEHRRLADAGPAHDQDRLPGLDEVVDDLDRAVDGPPDPAGQPDDLAVPVADRADPVERPLDPGPVVVAERPDVVDDVGDVGLADLAIEQRHLAVREARLRPAAEVEDDLDEVLLGGQRVDGLDDLRRQRREEQRRGRRSPRVDPFRASTVPPLVAGWILQRTAGTSAGSATRTTVSFISSVTVRLDAEAGVLEPPVDRRLVGSHGRDDPVVVAAAARGPGGDHAETVVHERRDVRRPGGRGS